MPTQRPFLSNFLAAFRAHQHPPLPKAGPSISSTTANGQTLWTSSSSSSPSSVTKLASSTTASSTEATIASPRPINPNKSTYNTSSTSTTTLAPAATTDRPQQFLQHNVSPSTHLPRSTPSPGLPAYGPPNRPSASSPATPPAYPTPQESQPWASARRARRGSDSSADSAGFREVRPHAGEKWFVGGRTASGEERYYALSQIRRDRSSDRISTDQLSL